MNRTSAATDPWAFPFADRSGGRLTRHQWLWLIAGFAALHYLSLALAVWSGNFDPAPNHDHAHVMRDVLATGLPQRAVWPPGYGYYLALQHGLTGWLGLPFWTGKLVLDVWLVVAAGCVSTALGGALTRNRRLAVASGLGLVAAPIFLLSSAEGLAVLLFEPFFLLSLLLVVRAVQSREDARAASLGRSAAAGAVMGLACLVRANPQFLILALVPFVWIALRPAHRSAMQTALRTGALVLIFLLTQSLVTAPWQLWQRRLGKSGLLAAPVFFYSFVDGMARHPGNRVSDWVREHRSELPLNLDTVVEINRRWLREDPAALLRLYVLKAARTWTLSDSGRWDRAILLLHLPWWLAGIAGLAVWLRRARGDPALLLVLVVLVYMWGVAAVASGLARYMAPVYGFLGVLGGAAQLGSPKSWNADQ